MGDSNTPPDEKTFGKHPTQKPLALLERIIAAASQPKDLILDPFSGSSTTGLAAYQQNRRFIGIDSDSDSLDLSIKRFESLTAQKSGRSK